MYTYAFLDTETTGLNADTQEMFELAVVLKQRDEETGEFSGEERIHIMIGPENLAAASQAALDISGFNKRAKEVDLKPGRIVNMLDRSLVLDQGQKGIAMFVRDKLKGVSIVGANPAFDVRFLEAWFKKFGISGEWHHRLIDVEAMAMQKFGYIRPKGLQDIAVEVGYDARDAHTAMGDVDTVIGVFEALVQP